MQCRCILKSVDARLLNSRKVLIRVGIACTVQVFSPRIQTQYHISEPAKTLQLQRREIPMRLPMGVGDRSFSVNEELDLPVTEEVVGEYLRLPEVAEDFYAYYELYRKYRDDYGIGEILRGQAQPAVFERLMKAGFDERLSVVNLLLDALKAPLCELFETKRFTDTPESMAVSDAMTHAFDFLEDAFGTEGSQEMLLFVTGLTMCKETAVFLAMNPQPKYMKYNEELLSGGRRQKLLQEMKTS